MAKKSIGLEIQLPVLIFGSSSFSLEKSISACVYAQIKKNPGLKSQDAKLYCENEIKVKKNE